MLFYLYFYARRYTEFICNCVILLVVNHINRNENKVIQHRSEPYKLRSNSQMKKVY